MPAVARIKCTVGTADGAAGVKETDKEKTKLFHFIEVSSLRTLYDYLMSASIYFL